MKTLKIILISIFAVTLFVSCSSDDKDSNPEGLIEGVALLATDNEEMPLIIQHIDGGRIVTIDENEDGNLDRLVYTEDNRFLVAELNPISQLPSRITTSDNTVFLFAYKDDNTLVDIAVVQANDEIGYIRDVPIDLPTRSNARASGPFEAVQAGLFAIGTALGSIACITTAGGLVISTAGLAIPAAIAACGSLVVGVAGFINANSQSQSQVVGHLDNTNNVYTIVQGVLGCASANFSNCVSGIITSTGLILAQINGIWVTIGEDSIALAEGALNTGFGLIKVTLTWNTTSDIDLWVTDPSGERIYYAHPSSASGGFLDVDDVNGHGPENIFWQNSTPSGSYLVQAHYFSDNGQGSTNYNVQIEILGSVEVFTGTLSEPGDLDDVFTFNISLNNAIEVRQLGTTTSQIKMPPKK